MQRLYLVTYKKLGKAELVDRQDYEVCIKKLRKKGDLIDYTLERDRCMKWHFHGIFRTRKNCLISQYTISGYNLNITMIDESEESLVNVLDYIYKDVTKNYPNLEKPQVEEMIQDRYNFIIKYLMY